jgi:hypothetical protein
LLVRFPKTASSLLHHFVSVPRWEAAILFPSHASMSCW